jgi:ribosomal protein S18 acetylase RimI-like enzyme
LAYAKAIEVATYGEDGEYRIMEKTGLSVLPLRAFISAFTEELTEYYDEDFGSVYTGMEELEGSPDSFVRAYTQEKLIDDSQFGDTIVFVLADLMTNTDPTWVPPHIQKKYKRAGKLRRKKLRHQWAYENPLNRIHGFLIIKEVTNAQHTKTTMCIDTICSTYFTKKRGIGSDLMVLAKDFSKALGAADIVLEVANEYSAKGFPEGYGDDPDDPDESDEESDEESDGESDGESDDEDSIWTPDDNVMSILSDEFWKKCMRKDGNKVYYNLDQEYIEAGLWNYFHCALESGDKSEVWEGSGKRIISDKDDPKDTEYGGFWYQKGKRSQKDLMRFYEKFGFIEDEKVHTEWCIFSEIPYPSMRLPLE